MTKKQKLILGIGLAAVTTGILVYAVRRARACNRSANVADEGYETAHDILYPEKKHRGAKLHFGPVLPA